MTDDSGQPPWMPAMFTRQMQEAGEQVAESQQELFRQFVEASSSPFSELPGYPPMGTNTATFKARVQSGGRVSIPEPERDALDIEEGDIVQTIVVPVKRTRDE
ncbi:AbrB/MazE/SpoVT family DNA-binding domain-containing protein [Natronobiforma cellulositropha]|uniref:AbrB/MazE/SpoVT family DNA-binding domain-containing protein n=1 Tax=Natronobiforma cellulositropha TaxID=1679076 RepID=UPI0021D5D075|nr:AbrB/MazE/SpoVT family DNA-binding domain-containing protein [Natronobiforma cellulositropha]